MLRTRGAAKADFVEVYISGMTEHDLLEVVEIEETCGLSRWGWEAYHAELMQETGGRLMLVARPRLAENVNSSERVAGYIAARLVADDLHINNFAVRPAYRRSGIGRALLNSVIKEGARLGARAALLEVRVSNVPAQALYAQCGFRTVGRRRNYYGEPTEDALIMRALFLPPA